MVAWTPADLAVAPLLWLDAATSASLTVASGKVSAWASRSGSISVAQATGANQPSRTVAALNGLDVVNIDQDQYMGFSVNPVASVTAAAMFSMFRKSAGNDPASDPQHSGGMLNHTGSSGNSSHYPWTDSNIYDDFCSSVRKTVGDPGLLTDWHLAMFQSAASDWRYAFNAVDFYTTTSNTVSVTSGSPTLSDASFATAGDVAEVVLLGYVPTSGDRQNLEGYLAWKWGQQANLPVGHTYASAAPTTGAGPTPVPSFRAYIL